ncbi:hypothetical protein [Fodinibius sp.]|uniref:hypothetical protein n=1 Tax=Fodinibius sp. TaxID=1872440 RepID=UPI002ACDA65A|nr:hypothetical protein [Fodinibius sp.]MDZ7660068.1 hypothetical protein [Fodinibius sp.]
MDYSDFLSNEPFLDEFPRQIVVIKSKDGSENVLHLNNQRLTGLNLEDANSQIRKIINSYFESNDETVKAKIFTLKNGDEKQLVGTIFNSKK